MKIETLNEYTPADAERIRELLKQLSRSGKDKGEIPKSWFDDIISSPWHDLLIAREEATASPAGNGSDATSASDAASPGRIIGIACLSVVMGPGIRKNAYLEDFVTDESVRGRGVGSKLWNAMLAWSREKGCRNLEFTSGRDRLAAHSFYTHHGSEIYDTAYFRKQL